LIYNTDLCCVNLSFKQQKSSEPITKNSKSPLITKNVPTKDLELLLPFKEILISPKI